MRKYLGQPATAIILNEGMSEVIASEAYGIQGVVGYLPDDSIVSVATINGIAMSIVHNGMMYHYEGMDLSGKIVETPFEHKQKREDL